MDFKLAGGFYSAPFPSESRRGADGRVDLSAFPNPLANTYAAGLIQIAAAAADGFGTTSTVYFAFDGPLDPKSLPALNDTVAAASPVFLMAVEGQDAGVRVPVQAHFLADGGPYGAPNLLALLPLQGAPLRATTLYAAGVTRALTDAQGRSLGVAAQMAQLASGSAPAGMSDAVLTDYRAALAQLAKSGIAASSLAGLAVFQTGNPTQGLKTVAVDALANAPSATLTPFMRTDLYDGYCVYQSTIQMPDYQAGTPPFGTTGGDWQFDATGKPILQRMETANVYVTVPRATMPTAGFPTVVFERAGGGGDRPLIDRGVSTGSTFTGAVTPGTGPAQELAKVGWAGMSIDGPLEGLRNTTNGNEDFLLFNVLNPLAMRDNMRQSSLELIVQAHLLDWIRFNASDCPGLVTPNGGNVAFDTGMLALMGHSMGATITPPAIALEPRYRALIMSGAGGSWVDNIVYKKKPLDTKPLAEAVIGLTGDYQLTEWDPMLGLLQWAGEPADPPVYSRMITSESQPPRHVLMFQGIVDHYILPPIANAESLSLKLDLAGPELDANVPELSQFTPLGPLLPLSGRSAIALPVANNISSGGVMATAVVTQHPGDGIEDGHEIMFQTEEPKHEYRCFLQGLAAGMVRVPAPGPDCN
jgi:hypothetical protein